MVAGEAAQGNDDDEHDDVVDLRAVEGDDDPFSPERILAWLQRSSGGLHERTMKAAAAELLESRLVNRAE